MYDVDALIEAEWQKDPFPHVVLDGLWDESILRYARSEFPTYEDPRWVTYNDPEEFGKKAGPASMWGPTTSNFFKVVRSWDFSHDLEISTGISPLTADDLGGGMHVTGEGGRLEMHVDFNILPGDPRLERRLNLLVFLNDTWEREWGGALRLGQGVEVLPLFNRTVIFECSEVSYHGHPDAIVGDHLRRSLACYFYAPVRNETAEAHSTVWKP